MFKRFITALVAAIALIGLNVTFAAGAKATPVAFVLDAKPGLNAASDVAALWSANNTGVVLTLGACSGEHCIHAFYGDLSDCQGAMSAVGCTWRNADGSYSSEVALYVQTDYPYPTSPLQFNVLGHEVGHGIIHGLGGGYWHSPNSRDIMFGSLGVYDSPKSVTRSTRDYIASLLTPALKGRKP